MVAQTRIDAGLDGSNTVHVLFSTPDGREQADILYFDRRDEIHVNMALGVLCPIGCVECSATSIRKQLHSPRSLSYSSEEIEQKAYTIAQYVQPRLRERRFVVSAMNDDDPFRRPVEGVVGLVQAVFQGSTRAGVALDRLNLSSSLLATRHGSLIDLADRYESAFGSYLVQFQASLLANNVKHSIFAGDGALLQSIVRALGYYQTKMQAAAGRGMVWINYVAVRRGDFGRTDGPNLLDSIARVADVLATQNPNIVLKITRGTVAHLAGFEELSEADYSAFVHQVQERWGDRLFIYCPDLTGLPPEQYRCGRIQTLTTLLESVTLS